MGWLLRALTALAIVGLSVAGTIWLSPARAPAPASTLSPSGSASNAAAPDAVALASGQGAAASELALELLDAGGEQPGDAVRGDAGSAPARSLPEAHPLTLALCRPGMNWVSGDYCPGSALRGSECAVTPRSQRFCMDVHEYPNQPGVVPAVLISFSQAERYCEQEGKRLCTESEWTFACRGSTRLADCNFGRNLKQAPKTAFWDPAQVKEALAQSDGRRASAVSQCISDWATFDQLGNVQEWVRSEHSGNYAAALKGGHYNESSIGCERSIQSELPDQRYPHTGFRCCADPLVAVPEGP